MNEDRYIQVEENGYLGRARPNARRAVCRSNLKQISLGIMQYMEDNDNRYPLVAVNNVEYSDAEYSNMASDPPPYGWADAIQPYVKNIALYRCPDGYENHSSIPTQLGYIDYWFNRNLSHTLTKTVTDPAFNFMLGDGVAGDNARASLSAFPIAWKADETFPLRRHSDGANYAFADGHVKWLSSETAFQSKDYHFAPR